MKVLPFFLVMTALLLTPQFSRASMTVGEFLTAREEAAETNDVSTLVYVWGAMDAIEAFDNAIRESLGQTLFCISEDDEAVDVQGFLEEIEREIEFSMRRVIDPEVYRNETTVGEVGLIVLSRLYSCQTEN